MKIVFDSEEEKKNFTRDWCANDIGYVEKCIYDGANLDCEKCWEQKYNIEVKGKEEK